MALRGTLENLGLAGVLQLIAQSSRHGVLTVEHGAEQVSLFFAQGALVRTEGTGRHREEAQAGLLVRARVLTDAQLEAALAQRASTGERIWDVLAAMQLAHPDTLAQFARLHSTETVCRLMTLNEGAYALSTTTDQPRGQHPGLRADHLLMEALRQADTWPILRARVPHLHGVYRVARSLEDYLITQAVAPAPASPDAFDFSMDEGPGQEPEHVGNLNHADRTVFGLVDGQRDVQALVDLSRLGAFAVVEALVHLLDAGLVAVVEVSTRQRTEASVVSAPPRAPVRLVHLAAHAGRWAYAAAMAAALASTWIHRGHDPALEGAQSQLRWQQVAPNAAQALEVARARTGHYPSGQAWKAAPLAPAWYTTDGERYSLRPPSAPAAY
jgi:hypothetical protein